MVKIAEDLRFSPIKVHFKPFPEITISPQSLINDNKTSPESLDFIISSVKISALVSSYVISPNLLIPVQMLEVLCAPLATSNIDKIINTVFSAAVLGVICRYTSDGTLKKLSDDLYSLSKEAEKAGDLYSLSKEAEKASGRV